MKDKRSQIADSIYNNRSKLMRYFICAIVLGTVRYLLSLLAGFIMPAPAAELVSWILWAIIFYPAVKLFVYKNHCPHVYALMTQIIIYVFGATAVWLSNQILTGVLYMFSSSPSAAVMLGGGLSEVLCLRIMNKIFKK